MDLPSRHAAPHIDQLVGILVMCLKSSPGDPMIARVLAQQLEIVVGHKTAVQYVWLTNVQFIEKTF